MPYPNEHAARMNPPEYEKYARKKLDDGLWAVMGIKDGKSEVQAFRFEKEMWTVQEAKKWLKDHDHKPILFEPAGKTQYEFDYVPADESSEKEINELVEVTKKETFRLDDREIFGVGTWNGTKYVESDLDDIVESWKELKGNVGIPLKVLFGVGDKFKYGQTTLGHGQDQKLLNDSGLPAAGWMTDLKKVGNKILASFTNIPKTVYELIVNGGYRQVSPEIWSGVKNGLTGKVYKKVLTAVAFLGGTPPAQWGNEPLLESFKSMYATDTAQRDTYELDVNDEGTIIPNKEDEEMDEKIVKGLQEQVEKLSGEVTSLKATNETLSKELEGKNSELKTVKDQFSASLETTKRKDVEAFVEGLLKEGRLLPKDREYVVSDLMGQDGSTKKTFTFDGKSVESTDLDARKTFYSGIPVLVNPNGKTGHVDEDGKAISDTVKNVDGSEESKEIFTLVEKTLKERVAKGEKTTFQAVYEDVMREKTLKQS